VARSTLGFHPQFDAAPPVTPRVFATFFALAAMITGWAGKSLLWRGMPFQSLWRLKPAAHATLAAWSPWSAFGFLALSVVTLAACYGVFRRRVWGWRLALAIFVANGLGDASRALDGAWVEAAVGVGAAVLILGWLTRPRVRALFEA